MKLYSGTHQDEIGVAIAEWFGALSGKPVFGPFSAMGWTGVDGLRASAIFNDYTGANIEIHIIGNMTRQTIRDAFSYAFNQLGVIRLTGKPHRENAQLRQMLPRLGFIYEATLKNYYGPQKKDDALVFRLERNAALKWMK